MDAIVKAIKRQQFVGIRELGILAFTVLLVILVSFGSSSFLTFDNFQDITLNTCILIMVAIGQMMVIVTAGIDLSVAAGLALSGMIVALTVRDFPGLSPALAVLMGAAVGTLLGALNGLIVSKGKVPPIITTLGTMSVYRGLAFVVSGGAWVSANEMPLGFKNIARGSVLGVPNLVIFAALTFLVFYYFLNHVRTGREIYAIGSDKEAARVTGIDVEKIQFLVFTLSGFLYGTAGVLWVSRYASAQSNSASSFMLQTVAAVVVGGVSIFGGSGKVFGVVVGAFLLGIIDNALNVTGVSPFWKLAIQGLVILLAVVVDEVMTSGIESVFKRGEA